MNNSVHLLIKLEYLVGKELELNKELSSAAGLRRGKDPTPPEADPSGESPAAESEDEST